MKKLHIIGSLLLVICAGSLALTGSPTQLTPLGSAEEFGSIVSSGEFSIDPMDFSDWLISDVPDLDVIDLRTQTEFSGFAIENSINIPFHELLTSEGMAALDKMNRTVLVCENGSKSGKAWVVLRSHGYDVISLEGGIEAWIDEVLTPTEPMKSGNSSMELGVVEKVNALREHYLGHGHTLSTVPPTPPVSKPKPMTSPPGKKRKKSGGC